MAANEFNISDIPDYGAIAKGQYAKRKQLEGTVTGNENDFLGRYRGAISGQEGYDMIAKRVGEELGLPTLQKNAQTLQSTVRNIPYTYSAASRGFDVNANQLSRIIAQKSAELSPLANEASGLASSAESEVGRRMGYVQAQQAKELLPFQTEQDFITDRSARELSGFDRFAETELNGLIQKVAQSITLSEAEKNRMQQLAVLEKNFQNQKALAQQQIDYQESVRSKPTLLEIWKATQGG